MMVRSRAARTFRRDRIGDRSMAGLWESKEISWSNIGVAPWQMKGAHKGRSRCALGERALKAWPCQTAPCRRRPARVHRSMGTRPVTPRENPYAATAFCRNALYDGE